MMRSQHDEHRQIRGVLASMFVSIVVLAGGTFAADASATDLRAHVVTSQVIAKVATISFATGAKEKALVDGNGFAVYLVTGDSATHPECSTACQSFWKPLSVKNPTAALRVGAGVKGKIAIWTHDGINQVTIDGHPLYLFGGVKKRDYAVHGLHNNFGPGTWRTVRPSGVAGE